MALAAPGLVPVADVGGLTLRRGIRYSAPASWPPIQACTVFGMLRGGGRILNASVPAAGRAPYDTRNSG